jgi:hypothetical protein
MVNTLGKGLLVSIVVLEWSENVVEEEVMAGKR